LTTAPIIHSAAQIAEHVGGELTGAAETPITGLSDFDEAQPGHLTLIGTQRFANRWSDCKASAALIKRGLDCPSVGDRVLIQVDNADLAFTKALTLYAPPPIHTEPGIHPTAVVHESATIGQGVRIGANCKIGPGVTIGENSVLHNCVTVLDHTKLGNDCTLWTGVVIREHCTLGDRCTIHPNTVVGADGFGYRPEMTEQGPRLVKTPQIGTVLIGNDVEIGASSCIDRAKCNATVIGNDCKIDNLVQIGHNCRLGNMVIISGCTGIGGSTTIGDGTVIGGHVGIADHVVIGPGAQLAGGSHVGGDLPGGAAYGGTPARPIRDFMREFAALRRLPKLLKQLRDR
jgi:UDP-3-O-[3-hydroxymyristoyl] glucosamine N-acyltransferase